MTKRILRRQEVEKLTGIPRSTLYAKIAVGDFPAPIKIGQKIGLVNIKIPGRDDIKLNLVSKNKVNGLGPIDKLKSAINYLIFGGDVY